MTRPLYGLRAWGLQRISSLYLLAFIVYAVALFVLDRPSAYEQWREWVAHPAVSVAIGVFFVSLLVHAWVGVRDVIMDYAHHIVVRLALLVLLALGLLACGVWVARVLVEAGMT